MLAYHTEQPVINYLWLHHNNSFLVNNNKVTIKHLYLFIKIISILLSQNQKIDPAWFIFSFTFTLFC